MSKPDTTRAPAIGKRAQADRPSWGRLERAYLIKAYRAGVRDGESEESDSPEKSKKEKPPQ
jgi:hypothetical protein